MGGIIRFFGGVIPAALVTIGLFIAMVILISNEYTPEEEDERVIIEIAPEVAELELVRQDRRIDRVEAVTPPPPPPQIERAQADKPTERIASVEGAIPTFDPPEIDRQTFQIAVSDRDAQPLVRVPPVYPDRAARDGIEGDCVMRFNVNPQGRPFDIQVVRCSHRVFENSSRKATEKFKYNPKIVDGRAVQMTGVETTFTYQLAD